MLRKFFDRYFPAPYRAVFTDEFTFKDNPLLTRDNRRDSRRKDRVLLLTICMLVLFSVVPLTLYMHYLIGPDNWKWTHTHRVSPQLGGSYGSMFLIFFAGLHMWFIGHAVSRRVNTLLLQEYRQNTLASLLCTRIPPYQLLIQASIHPFREAMFVALAGLPFYTIAWSLGGISLSSIAALYLFFAMYSFRPPRWALPVFAGIPADEILKRYKAKNQGGSVPFAGWLPLIFTSGGPLLSWAFGPSWNIKIFSPLWTLMPRSATPLIYSVVISWPIIWLKFLWTPIAYYQFTLPPIAIIIPLYLLTRLLTTWESSIFLRSGDSETEAVLWDLVFYYRLKRAAAIITPFLWLGFLWAPYVQSRSISGFVYINGGKPDQALAGLYWLMACLAALNCWQRVRETVTSPIGDDNRAKLTRLWYCTAPVVTIHLLYILACWLAGRFPFPHTVVVRLLPMLTVTLAGALAVCSIPAKPHWYALACVVPFVSVACYFPILSRWLICISPLSGLLSLTEHSQRIVNALPVPHIALQSWWICVIVQLTLIPVWRYVSAKVARSEQGQKSSLIAPYPAQPAQFLNTLPTVSSRPPEGLAAVQSHATSAEFAEPQIAAKAKKFERKPDTPVALSIIRWMQSRSDSAIVTRELRVLLRGKLSRNEIMTYVGLLVVIVIAVIYRADITEPMFMFPGRWMFNADLHGLSAIFGGLAVLLTPVTAFIAMAASCTICGASICKERDKSTLGFLLVTPLATSKIVRDKFIGCILPTMIFVLVMDVIIFAMSLTTLGVSLPVSFIESYLLMAFLPIQFAISSAAIGLAMSAIFRSQTDAQAMATGFMVLTVVGVSFITSYFQFIPVNMAIEHSWLAGWYGLMTVTNCTLTISGLWFTYWRIAKARTGDVAFESASVQA